MRSWRSSPAGRMRSSARIDRSGERLRRERQRDGRVRRRRAVRRELCSSTRGRRRHAREAEGRSGVRRTAARVAHDVTTRGANRSRRVAVDRDCGDGDSMGPILADSGSGWPRRSAPANVRGRHRSTHGIDPTGSRGPGAAWIAGRRRAWRVPRTHCSEGRRTSDQSCAARCHNPAAGRGVRSRPGGGRGRRLERRIRRFPDHRGRRDASTGVLVKGARYRLWTWKSPRALTVAIDLDQMAGGGVAGSDIHDNPGPALAIRSGASPRIAHNVFARNGLSERARVLADHRGRCGILVRGQRLQSYPERVPIPGARGQAERHARELVSGRSRLQDLRVRVPARPPRSMMATVFACRTIRDCRGDRPRRNGSGVSRHRHGPPAWR